MNTTDQTGFLLCPILTAASFTPEESEQAYDAWGFSCGPAAIAAILELKPKDIWLHLADYRGLMNPTEMNAALKTFDIRYWFESPKVDTINGWPKRGICRIQFHGPWMEPGVPIAARYQHTHWVAVRDSEIYDINVGGWSSISDWVELCVPYIARNHKRANGKWSVTHVYGVGEALSTEKRKVSR